MPLYEYKCKKCGHQFEKIQKYSDRMVKKCPDCGGRVEQTITAPAVQFKGTGWYVTDYAKKSSVPSGSSEGSSSTSEKSEGSSSSSEKSEGSSSNSEKKDSKPAKSEGKSEAKESKKSSESAKSRSSKD